MATEPDEYPVEEDDQPFSRLEDIKERFLAILWHDISNRTEFLLGVALMIVGLVGTILFE